MQRRIIALLCCSFIVAAGVALLSCARRNEAAVKSSEPRIPEKRVPMATPSATPEPTKAEVVLVPPQPGEVQQAIARVYKQAVVFDPKLPRSFLQGDFNGDGWPDIAAVVKPADGMLPELNHELAPWLRGEPQRVQATNLVHGVVRSLPKPEPVVIQERDTLLVIIHGHGSNGWRNPEARQSYLLRQVAGRQMTVQDGQPLFAALKRKGKFLRIQGDVIRQTLNDQPGFLYYDGAKYVWHH